ncbi:site-specific integrase [Cupriavidus sp.]|uniref:site-specific integrase n=1 Tax=Cupriavidus sp. TaxID=1873897 RepID=UPI0025B99245|nr:site-specific integrase [Cupriavidus sp.]MCA3190964.1 site-specific integrase [Cupriavidus sp.]MCA3199308.1 site-specific integrase [Cupriavidus sp.]MCA3204575.1 site-specific integrase [Cupriavidus sp.]MCA3209056.1 site-specific integrase [Cupriavidus sp.]MCA3233735.1 site-specific integrase [Cupriavidus sp.]
MAHHLTKRGNVYYLRRRIPLELIEQYGGKREIVRSLGVKERALAEREARRISVALDDEFEAARRSLTPAEPRLKPIPAERMDPAYCDEAAMHLQAEATAAHWDAVDEQQEKDEAEADRLERVLSIIDERRAKAGTAPLTTTQRTAIAPGNSKQEQAKPAKAASGQTLESLISIWQRERKPAQKTVDSAMRAVAEIRDPDVSTITRQTIIAYRDKLLDEGKAVGTINTRLSFIRILLGIAKDRGLVEINHADDTALAEDRRAVDARKPYSAEQAEAVMAATAGMKEARPAMYWLPRLARWTGARLNELHQLRKDDIQTRDAVPGLMITDEGEHGNGVDMRLKNQGSRRWVPLAEPVRDFAEWAEEQPDGPLFPAKPNKYGIVSDAFSKSYGRFLREVLKIKDSRITFHSWRHGFADMCRAAGVAPEVRMALMGHTESGVSGLYGAGEGLPVKRLINAIRSLDMDR